MADIAVSVLDSITDADPNQWNNVVEQSALGSVFQRHEWLALAEATLDLEPKHVVAEKGGNPVGVFPNFVSPIYVPGWTKVSTSLPVRELVSVDPGFGGPVVTGSEDDCLDALFDGLERISGFGTLHHTVRTNDLGYVRYGKPFAKRGYRPVNVNCRFRVHLERDWDDIRADMDADRRRALRQMDDRDVTYRDVPLEPEPLRETYEAYCRNIERAGGETFDFDFFEGLVDRLGDRVKVFGVAVDGREVGRYLYLLDDEQSTVHYYFAAIGDEAHFEDNPSELLHAHAIQWAQARGYRYYDFGGTGADYRDGVFRHKDGYGGEAIPTCQWQKGLSRVGWPAFRAARSFYRKTTY
ncbi:GNAT family N-acetyltransferase [Halobacterium litoreum]|uniref:GNAT family N-acetyltransferase n=1 Tax=Halobacterium litoreum TaxID=2039234 RepID=A0ABD5NF76_9EURY|nr:GNAT family N-acetyltransferase [Halobacterium litoreum]UHH13553.1 GNAT family N-acetyltransferase [Halobacterium litoreum]